ncbi:MAG: hypothetical protein NVSMB62_04830 [Acidobacteriaceae bacterium]
MDEPRTLPSTADEIAEFLAEFERRTLPKARWTHAAHVLAGAWYVHELGEEDAICRMRENVSRYNLAVGGKNAPTSGYHETVTVFWIKVLAAVHRASVPTDRTSFAVSAAERFGTHSTLHERFYSFDVMASEEARRVWIEPLKPIRIANL